MSGRKLTMLGVIAVLTVIWAVVQSHISSRPRLEPDTPAYLVQGLDPADIGSIVLGTGEDTVTLKRERGHFVVMGKDDYPAASRKINELITSCLDIRTAEFYTDDAANHKDLGVTEEAARDVVKFLRPDSSLLTGVVIGKTKEGGQGTYVRLSSSDKVYLALETPRIGSRAMDYINQDLVSINDKDIESVTVSYSNGEYALRAKEEAEGIVLENMPAGKKLKDNHYERVFGALSSLRCSDVKRASALRGRLLFDKKYVCRLKDSTVYTIRIAQKDDKSYVTCDAEFTDTSPVTKEKQVESEEELKKKEAKLLAHDKANDFSMKHRGWVYEIARYKAEDLTKELADLLEAEETDRSADPNAVKAEN